ncbi:MAG: acetylornithine carbamoyltransferase [Bacteroidota bacterium]
MQQFISAADVKNIDELIKEAQQFKLHPTLCKQLGQGKKIGLLFLNPSLRTRISTQIAAHNLGLETIVLNMDKEGWALEFAEGAVMNGTTVEHIKDAGPVLGQYLDILCIRTFPGLVSRELDYSEQILKQFIRYAGIPVVSMESATLHPLQSLADLMTMTETMQAAGWYGKRKPKVVLTWAPHIKPLPHCVANSFAQWVNAWQQADLVITHPPHYELDEQFTSGATITYHQEEALRDADFVYVKNWSGYADYGKMHPVDTDWMLTAKKWALTKQSGIMHCLPVRRNVELSDEILDAPYSLVTQQAANRVWSAQAVLASILNNSSIQ